VTTTSLFDRTIDLRSDSPTERARAEQRLLDAEQRLRKAEAAHRTRLAELDDAWRRSLPPLIGPNHAARIEEIHAELEAARAQGRRPWATRARRDAEILATEERLSLKRFGFASYEDFAARHAYPPKPAADPSPALESARREYARAAAALS
jgi:hypothetical protein